MTRTGAAALLVLLLAPAGPPPEERVWIVLTPDRGLDREALEDLLSLRPRHVRALLLVEDWNTLSTDSFSRQALATISAIEELGATIAGYDPESIERLRAWGVSRAPAIALEREGRVHVLHGTRARLSEVWRCSR